MEYGRSKEVFNADYNGILSSCINASINASNDSWGFLTNPNEEYLLNLSRASLCECLQAYADNRGAVHRSIVDNVRFCLYHLNRLEEKLHITLKPVQVTSVFYNRFIVYLVESGLCLSSVEMLLSSIRAALMWASKYQAKVHPSFTDIDVPKYKRSQIALTADEISMVYHFNLNTVKCRPQLRKSLECVRDMFVLGCNLGQRHSDLVRISKENFVDGKFRIIQQKTKNKAVVDLSRLAVDRKTTYEILEKYGYEAPYKADKSNYNKHLHQLMHFIFGEEMVEPSIVSGELSKTEKVLKYKAISSHTARRSFATHNYIIRNYPARIVMKATGHTEEKSFRSYICYDDEE